LTEINNIKEEISKHSYFLSLTFEDSRYSTSNWILGNFRTDQRTLLVKLRNICVSESNIIETENITISTSHFKESYKILNAYFQPIIDEVNVNFIAVFGEDSFTDMLKSYFLFYKKFNNIKVEYSSSNENYIMIYDHKPLCIWVEKMTKMEVPYLPHSITTQMFNTEEYVVEYKYQKELHNAIRFNLTDNPKKLERKLKIDEISKNSE